MNNRSNNITLEDVTIAFRNFSGAESSYNRAGDRNFAILLDAETADRLARLGWNVKTLNAREEGDEPQPYIQVALSYKVREPKIAIVTSKGMTYLPEGLVDQLDWVDIETADVILNPYEWRVNGKTGIKAYVTTLVVKIVEDYLINKWSAWVDDRKAISSGANTTEEDYIDGEIMHETRQIGA